MSIELYAGSFKELSHPVSSGRSCLRRGLWPKASKSIAVHAVDVRTWLSRLAQDAMSVFSETLGLLVASKLGGRQAEHADRCIVQGVALCWSTPNRVVLGQDNPVVLAGITEPGLVGEALCLFL